MSHKIASMRLLGESKRAGAKNPSRIQALTLPELAEMLRDVVHRVVKSGAEFEVHEKQPRDSHVVNAALIAFFAMSEADQDRVYLEGKKKLERLLGMEERPPMEAARRVVAGSGEGSEPTDESMPGGAKLTRRGNGRSDVG